MDSQRAAFTATSDAAQRVAGVIAARSRGDLAGAEALLTDLEPHARAAGAVFLADLVIALLARAENRTAHEVAAELSLHLATLPSPQC